MFCFIPKILHSLQVNFDAKQGSLSLMILEGSPYDGNTCLAYSAAFSSALISLLQGMMS